MSCEHTGAIEAAIERLAGAHGVNFANMRETCPVCGKLVLMDVKGPDLVVTRALEFPIHRSAWVAGPGLQDD